MSVESENRETGKNDKCTSPEVSVESSSSNAPIVTDADNIIADAVSNAVEATEPDLVCVMTEVTADSADTPSENNASPTESPDELPKPVAQVNAPQEEHALSMPVDVVVPSSDSQTSKVQPKPQSSPPAGRVEQDQHQKTSKPQSASISKPEQQQSIPLPNATVGKAYKYNMLRIHGFPIDVVEVVIEDLNDTGLHFDAESLILEGIPEKAGELSLVLRYRSSKQNDPSRYLTRMISLTINADPKSLWKDLPSDESEPYWKPNSDSCAILKERSLIAASQRGRSHAHEGRCRDDDFGLAYLESGWYLAVVADGAGASKSSRKGSHIVCSCALDHLKQHIENAFDTAFEARLAEHIKDRSNEAVKKAIRDNAYTLLAGAAHLGFKKIQEEATSQGVSPKDYATTLIVAVMRQYKYGWFVGTYWVGDGGIGIYSRNSKVHLLGEPDGGEFAGQTRFITMPEVWEASEIYKRVRFEVVDDFTAVILMTDGITDAKFESDNNLKNIEKWDVLWDDLTQTVPLTRRDGSSEQELLRWLDFWSPGNHDDRTIAILV